MYLLLFLQKARYLLSNLGKIFFAFSKRPPIYKIQKNDISCEMRYLNLCRFLILCIGMQFYFLLQILIFLHVLNMI